VYFLLLTLLSIFAFALQWLGRQKQEWRKAVNGEKCALLPDQVQRLIELGLGNARGPTDMNTAARKQDWENSFQLLVKYKEDHDGDLSMIKRKERDEYHSLAGWVGKFRNVLFFCFCFLTSNSSPCTAFFETFSQKRKESGTRTANTWPRLAKRKTRGAAA
jgi:hypothetical protein